MIHTAISSGIRSAGTFSQIQSWPAADKPKLNLQRNPRNSLIVRLRVRLLCRL